jgi:hypothetical protein
MARGKSASLALRVQPSAVFGQWSLSSTDSFETIATKAECSFEELIK